MGSHSYNDYNEIMMTFYILITEQLRNTLANGYQETSIIRGAYGRRRKDFTLRYIL